MRFKDNVALVVGSATGMGRSTVIKLVKEGAQVIAFDLLGDKLEELKAELADEPGVVDPFVGDITDIDARNGVIKYIGENYGRIDTLAYVAGTLDFLAPAHKISDELWDYVMDVNVNATFKIIREALPLMKDHEGRAANIVIVSSVGGFVASSSGTAYITSKHAVLGLMKNLSYAYRSNNIRVNAVNPGSFATSIMENTVLKWPGRSPVDPDGVPLFYKGGINTMGVAGGFIPIGDPAFIADAICFLISDEAQYINGAELTVDGGWSVI
jgi:NAD(P)-dependent dehydrogenase (short-subunit alcohol dehydrogenase family)